MLLKKRRKNRKLPHTPSACKAKGRAFQNIIKRDLIELGKQFGLREDDLLSRSMGANGTDIILSPAAKDLFGLIAIECKSVENITIPRAFKEHADKYPAFIPWLFHKRNFEDTLITLRVTDFLRVLKEALVGRGHEINKT